MRSKLSCALAFASLVGGCSKIDPPCPPGNMEVYLQEADEAMARKARRLEEEGDLDAGRAVTFNCGYDRLPDGSYRSVDQFSLGWGDVLWCLETMVQPRGVPLTQCLAAAARAHFTGKLLGGDQDVRVMVQVASKVTCVELSREVDLDAERHGLQRTGPGQWVPAVIWAVIQAAESIPVPSPAIFLIVPKRSGVEEACVDVQADPPKRCTAAGDCPEVPPGATPVPSGTGPGVIPPGTTPGGVGAASSGDYP